MRFQELALAVMATAASAASFPRAANGTVAASNGTVYTTEIVTAYTTYCPAATTIVQNSKTYTVTGATTLTITDCPCTISKAVTSSTPAAVVSTSSVAPHKNGTATASSTMAVYTGAADMAKPVVGLLALGAGAIALL